MALMGQAEREAISRRTKEALAVARSRGVRLGNPNAAAALRRAGKGAVALRAAVTVNADRHAQDLAPVVADIRAGGATSLRAIAAELTARGMLTSRGGRWHVSTVMNLLDQLGLREAAYASPGGCRSSRRDERGGRLAFVGADAGARLSPVRLDATLSQNLAIGAVFIAMSLVRSYLL